MGPHVVANYSMAVDPTSLRDHVKAFTAAATLAERTDAFIALVRWTRHDATGDARLDALLDLLEEPDERHRFHAAISTLLVEAESTNAFAHAGIPSERGFLAALGERIMDRVLPRPRNDQDLGYLLRRLFRDAADARQLSLLSNHRLARLTDALIPAGQTNARETVRRSFANGFRLLAFSVQAQGLSPKLRKRSRPCDLTESPFYQFSHVSEAVVECWIGGQAPTTQVEAWQRESRRCREELQEIHRRIERDGVSTHVVYGVELIERCLARMAAMIDVMAAPDCSVPPEALRRLIMTLASSLESDRSVFHLIAWNTHLLQRRIVERTGRTGEHYITGTRAEYRHMWIAAAGGGLLTVATAVLKTVLSTWHVSDFAHGILYGVNYAVSFLLLQRLGLVLATKQPAMTAAALATIVREQRGDDRATQIADYAARICRSQLAAVLGNVIVVSVGALVFVHAWYWIFHRPFMSYEEATDVYTHLSPLNSGTIFYAALTGVILWLASVLGGWFDNFSAYHRLPLAIAEHPAQRYVGRERLVRWGEALQRNGAAWMTNVSLGFMLGMTPALGDFLGLPIDVRHVTLNSGILTLAGTSLGNRWFGEGAFLLGSAGVAVMFVLNLSVSFLLALATAVRAYELPAQDNAALVRGLYRRFIASPRDFFVPPRAGQPGGEAGASH
jgi:site-specific recombinase